MTSSIPIPASASNTSYSAVSAHLSTSLPRWVHLIFSGTGKPPAIPRNTAAAGTRRLTEFEHKIAAIEGLRSGAQADIKKESIALHLLNDELAELEEETESARHEYAIVREAAALPFQPMFMPWSKQGEDERRYRKIMLIVLFIAFCLASVSYY